MKVKKMKNLPVFASWLLRRMSIYEDIHSILGDFEETYIRIAETDGLFKAQLWIFIQILRSFPEYIKLIITWRCIMFKNYLKSTLRNLRKDMVYTFINISGLVIGIGACLLILQYVTFELSYDNFHEKADNIYRLRTFFYLDEGVDEDPAYCVFAAGKAVTEVFPQILDYVQIRTNRFRGVYKYQEKVFREENILCASSSFFKIFSFKLLQGDPNTALTEPNTIVISNSTAEKYFGNGNPLGKSITLGRNNDFKITGVIEDAPENSHFKYDMIISYITLENNDDRGLYNSWNWAGVYTYLLLRQDADTGDLEQKFKKLIEPMSDETFGRWGYRMALLLQPLKSIHLNSHFAGEIENNGSREFIYVLFIIAAFILILGWINYISLSTAKSIKRASEIGVRKAFGAHRLQLILQFLSESLIINIIGCSVAIIAVIYLQPYFNQMIGIPHDYTSMKTMSFWMIFLGGFLLGSFLSGLYPAFLLSSFRPLNVLKGKTSGSYRCISLRKGFVLFQFTISTILIIGTFIVYKQVLFMRNKDIGVNVNQTMIVNGNVVQQDSLFVDFINNRVKVFKNELLKYPSITDVTHSTSVPGDIVPGPMSIRRKSDPPEDARSLYFLNVDYNYLDFYQNTFIAGRNLSRDFSTDSNAVILNEAAVHILGFKNPEDALNKQLILEFDEVFEVHVIGVIKNYNQSTLREDYSPIIVRHSEFPRQYSIRIQTKDLSNTISLIKKKWDEIFPRNPFDYYFLDDSFNELYRADMQFGRNFGVFTMLAIIVACLGLFGLSSFTVIQRTKEIGIRKVLGASVRNIVVLLTREFLVLIVSANIIAWPLAWYFMDRWLQDFAFRINMTIWIFIFSALISLVIALLTLSYQSIKAATTNPTDSLRYE